MANVRIFAECFIEIKTAGTDGDDSDDLLNPEVIPDEKEHIQPCGDKEVVHDPAYEKECPSDNHDLLHVASGNEEREDSHEHPHGAWIESIEESKEHGECGERKIEEIHFAKNPEIEDVFTFIRFAVFGACCTRAFDCDLFVTCEKFFKGEAPIGR